MLGFLSIIHDDVLEIFLNFYHGTRMRYLDVPMVAWPLFAEQRLNVVMLADGVGAAIRLPERKDKETIAAVVRELMAEEGKGAMVRVKAAELQKAAAEGHCEGGAAMTALDEVVEKWEAEAN